MKLMDLFFFADLKLLMRLPVWNEKNESLVADRSKAKWKFCLIKLVFVMVT